MRLSKAVRPAPPAQQLPAVQSSAPASGNNTDGDNDGGIGANLDVHV